MTDSEYIKRSIEMIRTEWFPKHRAAPAVDYVVDYHSFASHEASRFLPDRIDALQWANPDTSNYLVRYLTCRNLLIVSGDIGHAIYRWSQTVSFEWIANCDYSYFAEKIEGLDRGAFAFRWDSDICRERAHAYLKHQNNLTRGRWRKAGWDCYVNSENEWQRFLWDNSKLLGNDCEHAAVTWGRVPNNRCIGHWLGLRMALGIDTP